MAILLDPVQPAELHGGNYMLVVHISQPAKCAIFRRRRWGEASIAAPEAGGLLSGLRRGQRADVRPGPTRRLASAAPGRPAGLLGPPHRLRLLGPGRGRHLGHAGARSSRPEFTPRTRTHSAPAATAFSATSSRPPKISMISRRHWPRRPGRGPGRPAEQGADARSPRPRVSPGGRRWRWPAERTGRCRPGHQDDHQRQVHDRQADLLEGGEHLRLLPEDQQGQPDDAQHQAGADDHQHRQGDRLPHPA